MHSLAQAFAQTNSQGCHYIVNIKPALQSGVQINDTAGSGKLEARAAKVKLIIDHMDGGFIVVKRVSNQLNFPGFFGGLPG